MKKTLILAVALGTSLVAGRLLTAEERQGDCNCERTEPQIRPLRRSMATSSNSPVRRDAGESRRKVPTLSRRWSLPEQTQEDRQLYCREKVCGCKGKKYLVTLRFRGVVEPMMYKDGKMDATCSTSAVKPNNATYNIYKISVSSPESHYF